MKLRDLYEGYELKRGEDRQGDSRLPNHLYLESDDLQIIIYDKEINVELFGITKPIEEIKKIHDSLNYTPNKVFGSDEIINFLLQNKEELNEQPMNKSRDIKIEKVIGSYNLYGYSDWKIFDDAFGDMSSYMTRNMSIKFKNVNNVNNEYSIPTCEAIHIYDDSYGGYLCKKANKIISIKDGIVEKFFKGWDNTDSDMISIRGWYRLK